MKTKFKPAIKQFLGEWQGMSQEMQVASHVRSMIDRDGAVILDLAAGSYYSLNGVAATIWEKVENGRTPTEILRDLKNSYDTPEGRLERDLDQFLSQLTNKGLLHAH